LSLLFAGVVVVVEWRLRLRLQINIYHSIEASLTCAGLASILWGKRHLSALFRRATPISCHQPMTREGL
jgi:hypothetical protein